MKIKHFPLILTALAVSFILPLVNVMGIWPLYVELSSDVAVSELSSQIVNILYRAIAVITSYAIAACVGYSLVTRAHRAFVLLISFLSLPVIYYALVATDARFVTITMDYIEMNIINCIFEMVQLGIVVGAVLLFASKKKLNRSLRFLNFSSGLSRTAIICPAVIFLWRLVSNLTETITLLVNIGAPQNISEVYTLVTPHVESIIFFLVGYIVTFIMMALFEGYVRNNQNHT